MTFELVSPEFASEAEIPRKYTRLGDNLSPPLQWSGAPEGAKSFVLALEDPDAPMKDAGGVFKHWAIYDIPPDRTGLGQGEAAATDLPQARNDFDAAGYDGPEPPGGQRHRYEFHLLALDVPSLDLPESPHVNDVLHAAREHAIARAVLAGTVERGSKYEA